MLAIKNGRAPVVSPQFLGAKDLTQCIWLFYSIKTMPLIVDVCTQDLPATLPVTCGPKSAAVLCKQTVIAAC